MQHPDSQDTFQFVLSTFRNKRDARPVEQLFTLGALVGMVRQPALRRQKDGPLFCGAKFEPAHREAANVQEVAALFLDYDLAARWETEIARWKASGYWFVAYTTYSHTEARHKFRVVLPLACPIPPELYPSLWQWACKFTDQQIDQTPKSVASVFYQPARASEQALYWHDANGGYLLDWTELDLSEPETVAAMPAVAPKAPIVAPQPISGDRTARYVRAAFEREIQALEQAPDGQRNFLLNKAAYKLGGYVGKGDLTRSEIEQRLEAACYINGLDQDKDGGGIAGVRRTIKSGLDAGERKPRALPAATRAVNFPNQAPASGQGETETTEQIEHPEWPEWTDAGMVERLWRAFPDELVYVAAWGKWGEWTGERWDFEKGEAGFQTRLFAVSQQAESDEPEGNWSDRQSREFTKFASKYRGAAGVRAALELARRDARFIRTVEQLDSNPWLLNCRNGTLDLRTGELRLFEKTDYITRQIATAWDEAARCPQWEKFIAETFGNNVRMTDFLAECLGYSLTGDVTKQLFFLCVGEGENGKGVTLQVVERILGRGYFRNAAASAFEERNFISGHTDEIAHLRGARFVVAAETNRASRLNEALVKRITGERSITASFKGQPNFEFSITFKIWMSVNHMPEIVGEDHGIWRRVIPIPFLYKVDPAKRIDGLERILYETEAPGILVWMVRGLWRMLEEGLRIPQEVKDAREDYKRESDPIGAFLDARCILGDGYSVTSAELRVAYLDYCEKNRNRKPLAERIFAACLRAHKCEAIRIGHDQRRAWKGIGLLA